jgi:hydroxypyruvate isomerase
MQGDIIRRINENKEFIGYYHVAGNPGRNEPDDSQEINYKAIIKAIEATGYTGYIGLEFLPTGDPLTSLRDAVFLVAGRS